MPTLAGLIVLNTRRAVLDSRIIRLGIRYSWDPVLLKGTLRTTTLTLPIIVGVLLTIVTGILRVETMIVTEGNLYGYPLPWIGVFGFLEPARTHYIWGNFVIDVLFYSAIGYGLVSLSIALGSKRPPPQTLFSHS